MLVKFALMSLGVAMMMGGCGGGVPIGGTKASPARLAETALARRGDSGIGPDLGCPRFVNFEGLQAFDAVVQVSTSAPAAVGVRLLPTGDPDTTITEVSIEIFAPGTDVTGWRPRFSPSFQDGTLPYLRRFDFTTFSSSVLPAVFDGRDDSGRALPPGLYPVAVRITVSESAGAPCLAGKASPTLIEDTLLAPAHVT